MKLSERIEQGLLVEGKRFMIGELLLDIRQLEKERDGAVRWAGKGERKITHLLAVARTAKAMLRHENSPDWKIGLIPWREIAEGVDTDDLEALAEALAAVEDLL